MILWPDVVREAGDAGSDCAAIAGPGDAVAGRGEDIRVAGHERAEAHREHDGDDQRQDAAHDPCDGLSGVRRARGPSAGEGNPAQDGRDQASQRAKREQDEGHGGHEAGHAEDQSGYAQAVPRPG
jgi:hypothetical protein